MASSFPMLSTSVMPPLQKKDKVLSNWSELPPELLHSIMLLLGAEQIIENVQKVCTSWRRVSKEPLMWQKINLTNPNWIDYDIDNICRQAIDRSEGGLVEIMATNFVHDSLLVYITDRSSKLRSLCLVLSNLLSCKGIVQAVAKLPLLEELELDVSRAYLDGLDWKAIGYSCPRLKTLKLTYSSYTRRHKRRDDDDALAIAESMPELQHLQLIWNKLTDTGLKAILNKCPHLEHLDLRQCLNIKFFGGLEMQCSEKVKVFRRPADSTAAP